MIMVAPDPARDTPQQMRTWLDQFAPAFIGATGPIDQIVARARAPGIGITPPVTTDGGYQVTHGAQVPAYGREAQAREIDDSGVAPAAIAQDIPPLLAGSDAR
ncbi:SCO family protein [Pseudonocardia acidicola]|nr:SCO family protein [Pseudonocardia acidicola]